MNGRRRNSRDEQRENQLQPARQNVTINEDLLGYRITLLPEPKKSSEYFVRFTPIPGVVHAQDDVPQSTLENEAGPSTPTQDIVHIQAVPVSNNSSLSLGAQILGAIFQMMTEAESVRPPRGRGYRRFRRRAASRRAPSRRRSNRRTGRRRPDDTETDSDASMYEVVDVDYEKISDLKSPPELDWRIIPRYELSKRETARQEKELYFLMTSEVKHEEAQKPRLGEPACCVCHENAATRVVIPCGHRCLCRPCALYIATNRSSLGGSRLPKRCPMCQAAIGLMPRLR